MRAHVRVVLCLAALALCLAVAACGSDSDSGGASTTTGGKVDGGGESFVYNAAGASAPFQEALNASYLKAFDEQFNFKTTVDPFCCGIERLQAAQSSGNVPWSAVQWVTSADYELAKRAGLLEPLDTSVVPVDLLEPGTYDRYGYQVYTSGVQLAWLPDTYPAGEEPTTFTDLFDTDRFPGKRCLYQGSQFGGNFEGALLSAGVPSDELYPLDLDLAFRQLDKIKPDIVWWRSGAEAAQFLLDGTCKLGVIWNGVAQSTTNAGNPISVTWDQAITVYGMNTIPKGSPNPEAAQELLGLMLSDRDAQVEFISRTAYTSPLKDPATLPPDVAKWAPQGENLATTIAEDSIYYAENNAEITKAFNDWLVAGR